MDDPVTTEQLIQRAREGDREAFDRLTARFRGRLEGLIHTRLGPSLRAKVTTEDIVQETVLRAFRSIDRFERGDDDAFFRWLAGIASNVVRESARRHRGEQLLALDDEIPAGGVSQSRAGQRDERFDRLQSALDSLGPDHRTVILLARVERLPLTVPNRMDECAQAIPTPVDGDHERVFEAAGVVCRGEVAEVVFVLEE